MEYRLIIQLPRRGDNEAEDLLQALVATHPEVGPVLGEDLEAHTLDVVFSLDASDVDDAWEHGRIILADAASSSGLEPRAPVAVHCEQVVEREFATA